MTARVCPVHGEYAPTGVCRWCEAPRRMPTNLPAGSTPCRCGEYAWLPGAVGERNGVIAGVAHSPEQCFRLYAEPPALDAYTAALGPPPPPFTLAREDSIAVHWILDFTPAICPEDLMAAFDVELATQHAALRWERVARRWNYKHRRPGGLDERERAYVWRSWLEQQQGIFDHSDWLRRQQERFIAAGVPKEWP